VRRVMLAGCSSSGKGEPSARTLFHSGSSERRCNNSSRGAPSIAAAMSLQSSIRPSASCRTTPAAMECRNWLVPTREVRRPAVSPLASFFATACSYLPVKWSLSVIYGSNIFLVTAT
jgi:hypothetical protein